MIDLETLQRDAERNPADPWAWWKLGAELLRTGGRSVFEQTAAAAALMHALSMTEDPALRGHLAASFAELGDADLTFETLRPVAGDPAIAADDQERVAHFLIEAGHSRRAVELLPADSAAVEEHVPLRLLRAVGLAASGDHTAALGDVQEVLRRDAAQLDALTLKARILGERGDAEACVDGWQEVVAQDPTDPQALTGFGIALAAVRRHDEAIDVLSRAMRQQPNAAAPCLNLALVLREAGQLGHAERAVKRAISLEPALALAHHDLGVIFETGAQWDGALVAFRRALELEPDRVATHLAVARCLEQGGRSQEALETLVKAASLQPRDPALRKQVIDAIAGMRTKVGRSDAFSGRLGEFSMWQVLELIQNHRSTGRIELSFDDIRANLFVKGGSLVRIALPNRPTLADSIAALPGIDRGAVTAALARMDSKDDVAVAHQLIARKLLTPGSMRQALDAQLLAALAPLMDRTNGAFAFHREEVTSGAEDGELDLRFAMLEIARLQDISVQ
jgi:tetratricopeptide (TPR) repeat protein